MLVPTQRRERTKSTSLSMPPSVEKKIRDYARKRGMSFSEFVTILCVNFLQADGQGGQHGGASDHVTEAKTEEET